MFYFPTDFNSCHFQGIIPFKFVISMKNRNSHETRMNENSPEKGGLGACVENVRCAQGFSSTNNVVSNGPIKSLCNVTHGRNLFSVFSI